MITRILDKIDKSVKEDIIPAIIIGLLFGLAAGLGAGLVAGLGTGLAAGLGVGLGTGLAAGLAAGLVAGLLAGLGTGLAAGLVAGLVAGLGTGLAAGLTNLSQLFTLSPLNIGIFILGIFLLMEFFVLIQTKIKNPTTKQVIGRKLIALVESLIVIVNSLNIVWLFRTYKINWGIVLQWIGYIGAALIAMGVILLLGWILIELNKMILTKNK